MALQGKEMGQLQLAEVIDLMALLKRSIGTKGGKPAPEKPSNTPSKTGRKVAVKSIAKAKNSTSAKAPNASAKKPATLRRSRVWASINIGKSEISR